MRNWPAGVGVLCESASIHLSPPLPLGPVLAIPSLQALGKQQSARLMSPGHPGAWIRVRSGTVTRLSRRGWGEAMGAPEKLEVGRPLPL